MLKLMADWLGRLQCSLRYPSWIHGVWPPEKGAVGE